jgi:hypothetical protein
VSHIHPEFDRPQPAPDGVPLGGVVAIGGAVTAAITGAILLIDSYRHRNPRYSCSDVSPDVEALGIDVTFADAVEGSYEMWPFGLTCQFPRIGGGIVTVGPDPLLTIVLVCFLGAVAVTVAGLVAAGVAWARRNSRTT